MFVTYIQVNLILLIKLYSLDDAYDACQECQSDSSPERIFHFLLRIADAEGTELDILISGKEV